MPLCYCNSEQADLKFPFLECEFFTLPVTVNFSLCVPDAFKQHMTVNLSLLDLCPRACLSFSKTRVLVGKHFQ
jgi:hypothetical protein